MCIGTFSIHTNEAASERFNHSFHFHANIDRLWANCCSPQVHGVSLQVASGFRLLQIVDMLHTLLHRMWMVQKNHQLIGLSTLLHQTLLCCFHAFGWHDMVVRIFALLYLNWYASTATLIVIIYYYYYIIYTDTDIYMENCLCFHL